MSHDHEELRTAIETKGDQLRAKIEAEIAKAQQSIDTIDHILSGRGYIDVGSRGLMSAQRSKAMERLADLKAQLATQTTLRAEYIAHVRTIIANHEAALVRFDGILSNATPEQGAFFKERRDRIIRSIEQWRAHLAKFTPTEAQP